MKVPEPASMKKKGQMRQQDSEERSVETLKEREPTGVCLSWGMWNLVHLESIPFF